MSYDFNRIYFEFGSSGIAPFVQTIENQLIYKLVTGVAAIDPYRGSAVGRAYSGLGI